MSNIQMSTTLNKKYYKYVWYIDFIGLQCPTISYKGLSAKWK